MRYVGTSIHEAILAKYKLAKLGGLGKEPRTHMVQTLKGHRQAESLFVYKQVKECRVSGN